MHAQTDTPALTSDMSRGLFLEADSLHFFAAFNGWKKEGRKREKNEGGGNEHGDEGTFKEKSANNTPLMT